MRGVNDGAVKGEIARNERLVGGVFGIAAVFGDRDPHRLEVFVGPPGSCETGTGDFDHGADFVQLQGGAIFESYGAIDHPHQIVERNPAHERAAPASHFDDAESDKRLHCFPDRRTADSEHGGELRFGRQFVAVLELPLTNQLQEAVTDLFGSFAGIDRSEAETGLRLSAVGSGLLIAAAVGCG